MRWLFPILLSWCLLAPASAEDPVYFADPNLKTVVESRLRVSDPTPTDMLGLGSLGCFNAGIVDLTGLEYATNLQVLLLRNNQISDLSPLSGLTNLEDLYLNVNQISDASPLSGLTNLRHLILHDNRISDLSFLSDLANIESLDLRGNHVRDISPLASLAGLTTLYLRGNYVSDLSPLLGLTGLETVDLAFNPLNAQAYCSHLQTIVENNPGIGLSHSPNRTPPSDITASGGTFPDRVHIMWEPVCNGPNYTDRYYQVSRTVSVEGLRTPISEWQSTLDFDDVTAEPGTIYAYWVQTTPFDEGTTSGEHSEAELGWVPGEPGLTIASGPGGGVATPGEGVHAVEVGQVVEVRAVPVDANLYAFAGWTGTAAMTDLVADPNAASTTVTISDARSELKANFLSKMDTVYVDDDALGDPLEDGTAEHPFDTIQEGIDVAVDGTTVIVRDGTYRECIVFRGRNITVTGSEPNAPLVPKPFPVIDANYAGTVVTFERGEDPNCALTGFVITRGEGDFASAVRCEDSSPTIANCLIVGNRLVHVRGGAVYCTDSGAVFVNCTVADNAAQGLRQGIYLNATTVTLVNSIVWGSASDGRIIDYLTTRHRSKLSITYCDVARGWSGVGNVDVDPLFARRGWWADPNDPEVAVGAETPGAIWMPGDYHLQSQAGRWDPITQGWVQDEVTSPCIDAGDPNSPVGREPSPDGSIINMGAYGGSAQASLGR